MKIQAVNRPFRKLISIHPPAENCSIILINIHTFFATWKHTLKLSVVNEKQDVIFQSEAEFTHLLPTPFFLPFFFSFFPPTPNGLTTVPMQKSQQRRSTKADVPNVWFHFQLTQKRCPRSRNSPTSPAALQQRLLPNAEPSPFEVEICFRLKPSKAYAQLQGRI